MITFCLFEQFFSQTACIGDVRTRNAELPTKEGAPLFNLTLENPHPLMHKEKEMDALLDGVWSGRGCILRTPEKDHLKQCGCPYSYFRRACTTQKYYLFFPLYFLTLHLHFL